MKCLVCGATMKTTRENVRYAACGLPHVTLRNVEVSRCPQCGEEEVAIPKIEALHKAIASFDNVFENWRYMYEGQAESVEVGFLLELLSFMDAVTLELIRSDDT